MLAVKLHTLSVLEKTRELVYGGWVQKMAAQDMAGEQASTYDLHACKFCMGAAVDRAAANVGIDAVYARSSAREHAFEQIGRLVVEDAGVIDRNSVDELINAIVEWNDRPGRIKAQVVDTLDQAIANTKEDIENGVYGS